MAFPVFEGDNNTNYTGGGTDWGAANMPASISAGDLLIAIVSSDGGSVGITFSGSTTSWTKIADGASYSGGGCTMGIAYANAVGTGDDLSITTDQSQSGTILVCRISGAETGSSPTLGAVETGTSTTPTVGNCNPGTAQDYLWLAIHAADHRRVTGTPYEPTDFNTGVYYRHSQTGGASLGYAHRNLNASSLDPDNFTMGTSEGWVTCMLAIAPPGASGIALPGMGGTSIGTSAFGGFLR